MAVFPLAGFFDAAHGNFERAARAQPGSRKSSRDGFIGVRMLTETARADCFRRLSAWADGEDSGLEEWRRPAHFEGTRRDGIAILPGTDPLPFAAECGRAGSFGLVMHQRIDPARPAGEIKRLLTSTPLGMKPYGRLETPLRFIHNQIAMQFYKHGTS